MGDCAYTHVAFADESNWNQGRFRSISLVSASVEDARAFHQELDALRQSHGKIEYKWKKTRREHGVALADFFFARRDKMRVDVIVWDIEDSRHGGLCGRDDKDRLPILDYVRQEAGKRSLQVSLDSSNGLSTKNPINPLNFWLYTPQRANDKAPVKSIR